MATVDALVIGRKTYETVLTFDTWPYGEKPVFVLSTRTLAHAPLGAVVERMSGDPAEIGLQLDARGILHVYVDGGITIQRFLQAGLIQRLIITRIPVLIGTGIPLFGALQRDIVVRHARHGSTPAASFRVSMCRLTRRCSRRAARARQAESLNHQRRSRLSGMALDRL